MIFVLIILAAIAAIVWLGINLGPARRHSLDYTLETDDAPALGKELPGVVILCPGRNEADHIRQTLPELCEQDYPGPGVRVVYVDDASDDDTPAITRSMSARYPNLLVVRNEGSPPAGWVGKCWAVHRGYEALREEESLSRESKTRLGGRPAEWVCFTDADIHWHPLCLRTAMDHALEHDADVVALFPSLDFGSASERLVQAMMVLALGIFFPFERAMDPKHPGTITGGAFMLVRRSHYDAIGGHEAVKSCVVEDINLGRTLKARGAKIRLAVTRSLMHCRMYEGWADMWEGLTKNAYAGLEYRPSLFVLLTLVTLIANILPPAYLAAGIALRSPVVIALSCAAILAQARPMNAVRKLLGLRWWYAFALPVGSAIYLLIIIASVWRYYRGGNTWKGRTYGPSR